MTVPSILFGFVISSLVGAGFHFWRGGGPGKLFLYIILSWIGFWVGHIAGSSLGWKFGFVGPLNLGMALIGNIAILGMGYWLSLVQTSTK